MRHNQCAACGSTDNLQYHHLIPRSLGGSDNETNLITLCGGCHAKAHDSKAQRWGHKELTLDALARKKVRGERTGSIPYGHTLAADGVRLERNETEQAAIAEAHKLKTSGASYSAIARELTAQGFFSRGTAWHPQTIKNILNTQPPSKHPW